MLRSVSNKNTELSNTDTARTDVTIVSLECHIFQISSAITNLMNCKTTTNAHNNVHFVAMLTHVLCISLVCIVGLYRVGRLIEKCFSSLMSVEEGVII